MLVVPCAIPLRSSRQLRNKLLNVMALLLELGHFCYNRSPPTENLYRADTQTMFTWNLYLSGTFRYHSSMNGRSTELGISYCSVLAADSDTFSALGCPTTFSFVQQYCSARYCQLLSSNAVGMLYFSA